MLLGFKTELKLNNKQKTQLLQHCGVSRHAWNWGLELCLNILEHNSNNPEDKLKFPSAIDLHKLLVSMVKSENPWYYEVSKSAPQESLRNLRTAWDRCFKKVSKRPKFKKKGKNDSFTLEGSITVKSSRKIRVPKIGVLRTYENLPQVKPKSVSISRKADKWFISFRFDSEPKPSETLGSPVGVDLGLLSFATLSNRRKIDAPKPLKANLKRLAKLQRKSRKKEKFSNNWKKDQVKVAKLHAKIANIRKDLIHKLTTNLAKNHSIIVIEDLNVSGMMANRKLSRAISDVGFYEFRRQLDYKTRLYGSEVFLSDRWFPSSKMCFNCGEKKVDLSLKDRTFSCSCGFSEDRDLNAAFNLVRLVQPEFKPMDREVPSPLDEIGNDHQR